MKVRKAKSNERGEFIADGRSYIVDAAGSIFELSESKSAYIHIGKTNGRTAKQAIKDILESEEDEEVCE